MGSRRSLSLPGSTEVRRHAVEKKGVKSRPSSSRLQRLRNVSGHAYFCGTSSGHLRYCSVSGVPENRPYKRGVQKERAFLSVRDIAEQTGHCQETVREWIRAGDLPAVRLGRRRYRVDEAVFVRFVEARQLDCPRPA